MKLLLICSKVIPLVFCVKLLLLMLMLIAGSTQIAVLKFWMLALIIVTPSLFEMLTPQPEPFPVKV